MANPAFEPAIAAGCTHLHPDALLELEQRINVLHVLIIEDEPLIALDLEDLLEKHGADSFSFADTERGAVEESRNHRPDFILSDVCLIQGTGPLAVEAIRLEFGAIPVIFLTATPEACSPCDPPGKIFRKPLDRAALGAAFRAMC